MRFLPRGPPFRKAYVTSPFSHALRDSAPLHATKMGFSRHVYDEIKLITNIPNSLLPTWIPKYLPISTSINIFHRFSFNLLRNSCCRVPSPFLYALEFAVVVWFRPDDRAALPLLQPLEVLLASMDGNRLACPCCAFFSHEALDSFAKLELWEDRIYFLVNRITT